MSARYREILGRAGEQRLAVVGDCMLDRFLWGKVDRISPEAPVPIVRLDRETTRLGGAANVASNLRALGAEVVLLAAVGRDAAADELAGLLTERGIGAGGLLRLEDRPTTLKTRIIAHSQQVVRADVESDGPLSAAAIDDLLGRLATMGPFSGIVLSDYGKGVLTNDGLARIIAHGRAQRVVVTVDPKNGDFSQYRGVTSLTPNQKEAGRACSIVIQDDAALARAGRLLQERTDAEAVLITRGEHGMTLFERGGAVHALPTKATEVYDVTGAGDTVIAVYTAALAAGATFLEAADLANHAAGLAVRELGTVAIPATAIAEAMGL
jgi:D-beta-D-heptose 7-phosphate kinase/D-beta-D-heptose 1-phosphate adenosyltransferase